MADPGGLGQRILQARLNMAARRGRPVTQQEIAEAMDVHSVTVGRWEGGIKEPDLETIAKLAQVLGVDPRWLAFGEGSVELPRNGGKDGPSHPMDRVKELPLDALVPVARPGKGKARRRA